MGECRKICSFAAQFLGAHRDWVIGPDYVKYYGARQASGPCRIDDSARRQESKDVVYLFYKDFLVAELANLISHNVSCH